MKKQAFNPFLPLDEYVPDGEPHVFGDRVYLFGSHDKETGEAFCMLDYVGWSAPVDDLGNWICSGVIYSATQDPLYDAKKRPHMYAPDVVQGNDGRFYLYYCMSGYGGKGCYCNPISVAVCDRPDGRYQYLGVVRNADKTPLLRYVCFDPAVMNDNGTIRLYYGTVTPWYEQIPFKFVREFVYTIVFGRTKEQIRAVPEGITGAYHVTLADDMLTVSSTPKRIDHSISGNAYQDHRFFEGSSIRKINETYFFIYSSLNNHELCYATSRYPDRDFSFRGTIVSNGDIGYMGRANSERLNHTGNNHGSIENINGQWYVFYHRPTYQSDCCRQACAEKINIMDGGYIPQVGITSCGLNDGPLNGQGTYPAAICCNLTNGEMRHGSYIKSKYNAPMVMPKNGKTIVGNIRNNTTVGYKFFCMEGSRKITLHIAGNFHGIVEVRTEFDGPAIAKMELMPGDTLCECDCVLAKGIYPIYFCFIGKGKAELIEFTISELPAALPG